MSLSTIREELVDVEGFDSSDQAYVDRQINRACKELYEEHFLYLSEREQIIELPQNQQQVTLPPEVEILIAMRRYTSRLKINLEDMRPRYKKLAWKENFFGYPYLKVRFKHRSPLHTTYTNFGPFTISIPVAEAADITATIIGETENAASIKESRILTAGQTSIAFTESFKAVHSFKKNRTTANDLTLKALTGEELAKIPNHKTEQTYPIFQVLDRYENYGNNNNFMEILYKLPFTKLVEDEDEFLEGYYDNAIYHKCREYLYERQDDKSNERVLAAQKAASNIEGINKQFMPDPDSRIEYPMPVGSRLMQKLKGGMVGRYPHEIR